MKTNIRWLIRKDMPSVMKIERESFDFPWTEDDFIRSLRQRNVIGMVVEHLEVVVGFMIYELRPNSISLWSIAVHPEFRRVGLGRALIEKLFTKTTGKRNKIVLECRERNVGAQLFLRDQGFLAIGVLREFYPETNEDAYLFTWHAPMTCV